MYAEGKGISQNNNEARKWFLKAAAQGDTNAQGNLEHLNKIDTTASVSASEIKFGPVEIGMTSCDAGLDLAGVSPSDSKVFISAITRGKAVSVPRGALGINWAKGGTLICDSSNNKVAAVSIKFPKNMAAEIAGALDKKYRQINYNLPQLGSGKALYRSNTGNSEAYISYEHVSFDANILISTPQFDEQEKNYNNQKRQAEQNDLSSTF